jgi:hypothetical protein
MAAPAGSSMRKAAPSAPPVRGQATSTKFTARPTADVQEGAAATSNFAFLCCRLQVAKV